MPRILSTFDIAEENCARRNEMPNAYEHLDTKLSFVEVNMTHLFNNQTHTHTQNDQVKVLSSILRCDFQRINAFDKTQ